MPHNLDLTEEKVLLKGFRDFILRGNVMDLAVAVIIGAAFTAIVTALTEDIIKPFLEILDKKAAVSLAAPIVTNGVHTT